MMTKRTYNKKQSTLLYTCCIDALKRFGVYGDNPYIAKKKFTMQIEQELEEDFKAFCGRYQKQPNPLLFRKFIDKIYDNMWETVSTWDNEKIKILMYLKNPKNLLKYFWYEEARKDEIMNFFHSVDTKLVKSVRDKLKRHKTDDFFIAM